MADRRAERKIAFAKVGRAHGVRGEVRVFCDDPSSQTLTTATQLTLRRPDGDAEYEVVRARPANRYWIVALRGVDDRDAAAALTGARCLVERAELPEPDDGEVYACDLIGLRVLDPDGAELGVVSDIFDNGAHDVLVYRPPAGPRSAERLVPFVDEFVPTIDLEAGIVTVVPLEVEDDEPGT